MKKNDTENIISNYGKLKIKDAQELYINIKNSNPEDKRVLREKLILSTLYRVFEYVDKYKNIIEKSTRYSIDELTSIMVEKWIEFVTSDKLLACDNYIVTLNAIFVSAQKELAEIKDMGSMLKKVYPARTVNSILGSKFNDCFNIYMRIKNENIELSYEQFNDKFFDILLKGNNDLNITSDDTFIIYTIFEKMWKKIKFDKEEDLETQLTKYSDIAYLLFREGFDEKISDSIGRYDIEEELNEKIDVDEFMETFKGFVEEEINEKDKFIVYSLFGLESFPIMTYKEVAQKLNISEVRVRQRLEKVFRRVRKSIPLFGKYWDYENYFSDLMIRDYIYKYEKHCEYKRLLMKD